MEISPDQIVYWEWGVVKLNASLVFSWVVMVVLTVGAWLVTRHLARGSQRSRWQNLLEVLVETLEVQIRETGLRPPRRYLAFIGTLFLFVLACNVLTVVPGFEAPTAALTTPVALAVCVFFAVPVFGITSQGVRGYFANYIEPTVFMLPFNIIGEVSRTVALAIRLFGNMMSGSLVVAILVSIAPLFFPVVMQAFGLLIGVIQAYVFAILALVYIASAVRAEEEEGSTAEALPSTSHSG